VSSFSLFLGERLGEGYKARLAVQPSLQNIWGFAEEGLDIVYIFEYYYWIVLAG
jgi:hypothetical protein